jgi:hypothetical protein
MFSQQNGIFSAFYGLILFLSLVKMYPAVKERHLTSVEVGGEVK